MTNLMTGRTIEAISSIEVANMIGKDHKVMLRDIRRYINQINKINFENNENKIVPVDFFKESTYVDVKGETRPCFNVSRKGCEFIAHKMTGQKGTEFTARYINRFHELEEESVVTSFVKALNSIVKSINSMNERLSHLEKSQNQTILELSDNKYKKPYNPWFAKMQPKYELLENHFNITRGQLYKNILWELENLYEVNTQQIQADYCYENNLNSCYPLEPYEFVPKYREMIEGIVNNNLIKYGIASESDPITSTKHITIFDTPAKKISTRNLLFNKQINRNAFREEH